MNEVPDTFPWLFRGYAVMGAIVVVYLLYLASRLRSIERRLRSERQE